MFDSILFYIIVLAIVIFILFILSVQWGTQWGSTKEEQAEKMPGDKYLEGGPKVRIKMTRAISINAPMEVVWLWLAQLGRGAGFYSIDKLDNGGIDSANHIVSWIPEAQPGDASAIGYLRHLQPKKRLVWWLSEEKFLGSTVRMIVDIYLKPNDDGSRLVMRISGDTKGATARFSMFLFKIIDSIMTHKQFIGIKQRAEQYGSATSAPDGEEIGERDQYQFYEVIYASGEKAGVPGKEKAAKWRQHAIEDGILKV
jgi:hypothetical protein